MQAVHVRRDSDRRLMIEEVEEPVCGAGDALVQVDLIAVNPPELLAQNAAEMGWDFAGRILKPANVGGPATDARGAIGSLG